MEFKVLLDKNSGLEVTFQISRDQEIEPVFNKPVDTNIIEWVNQIIEKRREQLELMGRGRTNNELLLESVKAFEGLPALQQQKMPLLDALKKLYEGEQAQA